MGKITWSVNTDESQALVEARSCNPGLGRLRQQPANRLEGAEGQAPEGALKPHSCPVGIEFTLKGSWAVWPSRLYLLLG